MIDDAREPNEPVRVLWLGEGGPQTELEKSFFNECMALKETPLPIQVDLASRLESPIWNSLSSCPHPLAIAFVPNTGDAERSRRFGFCTGLWLAVNSEETILFLSESGHPLPADLPRKHETVANSAEAVEHMRTHVESYITQVDGNRKGSDDSDPGDETDGVDSELRSRVAKRTNRAFNVTNVFTEEDVAICNRRVRPGLCKVRLGGLGVVSELRQNGSYLDRVARTLELMQETLQQIYMLHDDNLTWEHKQALYAQVITFLKRLLEMGRATDYVAETLGTVGEADNGLAQAADELIAASSSGYTANDSSKLNLLLEGIVGKILLARLALAQIVESHWRTLDNTWATTVPKPSPSSVGTDLVRISESIHAHYLREPNHDPWRM